MKILVACERLHTIGGSQTYQYTLVEELSKRNHEVSLLTNNYGIVSDKASKYAEIITEPENYYDLLIISQNVMLKKLLGVSGFKVFVSHGVTHEFSQPLKGADAYVSVTEEVKNNLTKLGFDSTLIGNGINCDRFKPYGDISPKPERVLSLARKKEVNKIIKEACDKLGIELTTNLNLGPVWEMEKLMNEHDLVFAVGRGIYESMACGRACIVFDYRTYNGSMYADGYVTIERLQELVKCNCSGRRYKEEWGVEEVIKAIKQYHQEDGAVNRKYAIRNFNIIDKVGELLQVYETRK